MRSFYADGLKDLCDDEAPKRKSAPKKSSKTASGAAAARASPPVASDRRGARGLHFDPLSPKRCPSRGPEHQNPSSETGTEAATRSALETMERSLSDEDGEQNSSAQATDQECDLIEEILKSMNAMQTDDQQRPPQADEGLPANGQEIAEVFMRQLLAKEVLYEPLKEITRNYVDWMQSGALEALSPEEQTRHRCLCSSLEDIVHAYETEPDNISQLTELFHTSQGYGAPPDHVYQQLVENPGDLSFQHEGTPPGCTTQ